VLSGQKPFLIYDSLVINEGATVDIEAGATFFMHHNADIIVKGTLRLNGTLENPVTIRGDRMDKMIGISYDLIPGQWGGIRLDSTSFNNVFEYAHIRNGNYGLVLEPSDPSKTKLTLKNVVMTNFKGALILSINCRLIAENSELSNSQSILLYLIGGNYSFTHCSIVNYYWSPQELGWGNSSNATVSLSPDYFPRSQMFAIQADFKNTLIWGSKHNDSSGILIDERDSSLISYYFQNCLLPNKGFNDERFVNCLWDEEPEFLDSDPIKDNRYEFFYDFRLDSISPARNVADPGIAGSLPLDMNGIDRFSDEGPDIGAYEWKMKN
jgi:hypothetical protein